MTFLVIFFSGLVGFAVLWWKTTHIDRNGWLPKPAMALLVPGGFLQATGMEDGLHVLGMRDTSQKGVSIVWKRKTYLGNAGYHYGNHQTLGGFTFVLLAQTIHDYDVIQPPYTAIVFPYWFLVALSACLLIYSTGIVHMIVLVWLRRTRRKPLSNRDGIDQ